MTPKGRTELIIGVSEAKLHEETDFDVQKWLAPPKPSQKCEKLISETKTNRFFFPVSKYEMTGLV